MSTDIKKIQFQSKHHNQSFFDLVDLSNLLALRPSDHSQFEHHRLTFYVLICIEEGSGIHSINFQDFTFEKGTVFAIRADSIHRFYPSKAKGQLLIFTEDFILNQVSQRSGSRIFQLFNEQLASPRQQLDTVSFKQIQTYVDEIKKEFYDIKDGFSADVIRSLLHLTFTHLLRCKSMENKSLTDSKYLNVFLRFQKLVEANFKERHGITYYANELAITPRTLNNITHSIVDKSAKSVVNDILMSHIKSLLINTSQNITQIAYETGFQETSHLSKAFKKHTGITPKAFKQKFGS